MMKTQEIRELKMLLQQTREDVDFLRKVIERQEKRIEAYKKAWRRVHPEDQDFMVEFGKQNEDPALFDVYNGLLYSFGRPDESGKVFTRLDSWHK